MGGGRRRTRGEGATFNNRKANSKETFRYCIPGQSYKFVGNLDETRKQSARASVPPRERIKEIYFIPSTDGK